MEVWSAHSNPDTAGGSALPFLAALLVSGVLLWRGIHDLLAIVLGLGAFFLLNLVC